MPTPHPSQTSSLNDGRTHASRAQIIAAFASIYLVWGSTYLAIRYADETIPPFLMGGIRFLVSGAILYAWSRYRGAERPTRIHWRNAVIAGALWICIVDISLFAPSTTGKSLEQVNEGT